MKRLSGLSRAALAHQAFGNPIPQEAYRLIDLVEEALFKENVPKINIRCEESFMAGSIKAACVTSLDVIRVEIEDDGSYTAVTDHFPKA